MERMKHVLVTGVSTGIGYATVGELLRHGYSVLGSVRKHEDAQRLRQEFGGEFTPLVFDVRREDEIRAAAVQVGEQVGECGLCGLINNAGISVPGPLSLIPAAKLQQQWEINVMGVFHVTRAFLPMLGTIPRDQPAGRIVNISSLSGRIAYPFMGAYAASKHALEALSDSWRRELMLYGIDLIVIQPGAIKTPIWDKSAPVSSEFADSDYGPILKRINLMEAKKTALPVQKVTRVIRHALECRRPKSRYVIPDRWVKYWIGPRVLPDRWLDWIIRRMLRLEK
jgi:NAD(P)-dependent dehydrogenase (short-subunit alcohol dehydrogenase family)